MIYSKISINMFDEKINTADNASNPDKYLGSVEPKLADLINDEVLRVVTKRKKIKAEKIKDICFVA